MKTFLAVFFGILAAVSVLLIAGWIYQQSENESARRVQESSLMALCQAAVQTNNVEITRDQLDAKLEAYGNAFSATAQVDLQNKLRQAGCYPQMTIEYARKLAKKKRQMGLLR